VNRAWVWVQFRGQRFGIYARLGDTMDVALSTHGGYGKDTQGRARGLGNEGRKGSLALGPVSDFVVLEHVAPSERARHHQSHTSAAYVRRYRDLSLALAHEHLKRFQQDGTTYTSPCHKRHFPRVNWRA
jgi:hypothetical protein